MKTQVIVFNVAHYDMGDNRGLSVLVLGDMVDTNNKFGVDISETTVPDYAELRKLQALTPDKFPAKFEADLSLTSIKAGNGKVKTGVALSNLKYLNTVKFGDLK